MNKRSKRHFVIRTEDMVWAIALVGCITQADEGHKITLISENPLLQYLASYLSPPSANMEEVRIPVTNEEYRALDVLTAKKTQIEIDLIMGMVVDQAVEVRETSIELLAPNLMFRDHDLVIKPAFYFPRMKPRQHLPSELNVLVDDVKYVEHAQRFLQGAGIDRVVYQSLDKMNQMEKIQCLVELQSPLTVYATDIRSELLWALRGWYKNYDSLNNLPCIMSFVPDARTELDGRRILVWPQSMTSSESVSLKEMETKGKWWKQMVDSRFDPTVFHRQRAGRA